ncbi:MAG: glycoside hydrolase family 3 protein [Rhodobacteraceae bacterium]|nr:glycoside hydrolase family 3 protein [Paracoccaceae bacterium]
MTEGAFIFGCEGPILSAREAAFFRETQPWGFILFGRNVESPAQLSVLTASLRDSVGRDAPVLIDQEGGRVQRMGPPHWRSWLPALDQVAAAPQAAARSMYLRFRLIAAELRTAGIDVDCAPLADIAGVTTHPFLKNRCYGTDAAGVAEAARAAADGLMAGGVLPVLKHIPGHGRATVDSHLDLPRVAAGLDELDASDFAPFRALADLPLGMTAHIVFDAVDRARPATASPDAIRLIRERIGFDGLLMTDDIAMQALAGNMAERTEAALAAGCDLVLHCNGVMSEMEAVAEAAGPLGSEARVRAEAALAQRRVPDAVDLAVLDAELSGLIGRRALV